MASIGLVLLAHPNRQADAQEAAASPTMETVEPYAISPPGNSEEIQYEQLPPLPGAPANAIVEAPPVQQDCPPAVSRLFRNYPIDFDPDQASQWPRATVADREFTLHLSELSETWLAANTNNMGLATTHVEFELAFAGPNSRISVAPSFQMHLLNGPNRPDLPARLYDIDLETTFTWRVSPRWTWELTVMPIVQSDFETSNTRLRLFGSVVGRYELTPVSSLVFGALASPYRGQSIILVLGLQWTPNDRWQVDFVLPEPKVAWKLPDHWLPSSWLYVRSQLFGGTWDYRQPNGQNGILEYDDQRLMIGLEGMFAGGGRWFVEGGIAYERQLWLPSSGRGRYLSDVGILQGGLRF
ncbi:MAG: hypothetical protein AB7O62_15000 [Pirellulales bacterium]